MFFSINLTRQKQWFFLSELKKIPSLVLVFLISCSSAAMIKKQERIEINKRLSDSVYRAQMDIKPQYEDEIVFKKGAMVRFYIESSDDWVRLRAYGEKESREQARGKTIVFLFASEIPEGKFARDILREKIQEKFELRSGHGL